MNQLKELEHVRVTQQLRIPLDISGVLFEAVRGWVSHHALRKVQEQRQLLQKPHRAPCSHVFTSSLGLPCSHTLKQLEEERQSLLLEHFHPHWHLKRDVAQPQPVLEPDRVASQLPQSRIQPETGTRREPSGFERVEGTRRAPSKCSKCHAVGHIMTSKNCPLRFQDLSRQVLNEESGQALSRGVTPQPDSVAVPISSIEQAPTAQEAPLPSRAVEVSVEFNRHSPSIAPVLLISSSPVSSHRDVSNTLVTNHSIGFPLEISDGGSLV